MAEEKKILLSRKKFITGTGASIAGLMLAGGLGSLMAGCAPPEEEVVDPGNNNNDIVVPDNDIQTPSWPFQYVKIDPAKAEELAYESYKAGNG